MTEKTMAELRAETDRLMHRPLHMDHEARIAALAAERNAADFEIERITRERDEAREEAHELTQLLAREAKIDPLHPNGRCRCAGDGQCEWCQRTEAREELDSITEVLDAAGVPQGADGPDGRRWTMSLRARVEYVIAELDEARAEVEMLRAALAKARGEVESLIPVDVDLLGLRLRATHPSPDDVGEAGSYQIMRLRTRRGEPILIDCGAGREIKITVRPSAGGATPEKAMQGEGEGASDA